MVNEKSHSTNKYDKGRNQFIIQIEKPGIKLDMQSIKELLKDSGVQLDKNYGPFCVNQTLGRYVVRGIADGETEQKLKSIPDVKIFYDRKIYPTDE